MTVTCGSKFALFVFAQIDSAGHNISDHTQSTALYICVYTNASEEEDLFVLGLGLFCLLPDITWM